MRQHKDSSIGDALKKKQWLFGVGGFLLLGLIVGCDKDEQPKQEVQAEPAAAAPADSAAEFSENTKLLLALYQELHLFKDDPEFHEVGFGACCRFHDWQTRVEELRSRTELETLMDIGRGAWRPPRSWLGIYEEQGQPNWVYTDDGPQIQVRRERDGGPAVSRENKKSRRKLRRRGARARARGGSSDSRAVT